MPLMRQGKENDLHYSPGKWYDWRNGRFQHRTDNPGFILFKRVRGRICVVRVDV